MVTVWENCRCAGERVKVTEQGRQEDAFQLTGHRIDVPTHGR